VQVPPNKYLSSEGESILGGIGETEMSPRCNRVISTKGQNFIRKFCRCVEFFLGEGGTFFYYNKTEGILNVPFRYTHLVKRWESK
jgi:hypothetical protein